MLWFAVAEFFLALGPLGTKLFTALLLPHAWVKGGHRLSPASVGAGYFHAFVPELLGLHVSHVVFCVCVFFFFPSDCFSLFPSLAVAAAG